MSKSCDVLGVEYPRYHSFMIYDNPNMVIAGSLLIICKQCGETRVVKTEPWQSPIKLQTDSPEDQGGN